ncbi:hypothetical protein Tco_1496621, partial [Tanacetum coccineum]
TPIVYSAADCENWDVIDSYQEPKIIMVNVFPPDHVDDLPEVEPNQTDLAPAIPKHALADENEEPKEEEEFKEKEADPLNPPPPTSDSESDDVVEVKNVVEHEDETVSASVHEKAHALVKKKGKPKDKYYGKLILDLGNEVQSSVEERAAAMENLVRKLGNAEERGECKKLKKELEESRLSNTLLRMQKERVERYLFWTRVQAYEFYREMIRRGVVFEERPNEAIDVPVKDKESPSSELQGSPCDF